MEGGIPNISEFDIWPLRPISHVHVTSSVNVPLVDAALCPQVERAVVHEVLPVRVGGKRRLDVEDAVAHEAVVAVVAVILELVVAAAPPRHHVLPLGLVQGVEVVLEHEHLLACCQKQKLFCITNFDVQNTIR